MMNEYEYWVGKKTLLDLFGARLIWDLIQSDVENGIDADPIAIDIMNHYISQGVIIGMPELPKANIADHLARVKRVNIYP